MSLSSSSIDIYKNDKIPAEILEYLDTVLEIARRILIIHNKSPLDIGECVKYIKQHFPADGKILLEGMMGSIVSMILTGRMGL